MKPNTIEIKMIFFFNKKNVRLFNKNYLHIFKVPFSRKILFYSSRISLVDFIEIILSIYILESFQNV